MEMVANATVEETSGLFRVVLGGAAIPFMKGGRRGVVAMARSRCMESCASSSTSMILDTLFAMLSELP